MPPKRTNNSLKKAPPSNDATGRTAEFWAAFWLSLKGYRIVARRFRANGGEIDLIARRGGILAMVEVKARPDLLSGMEAVSPVQQGRIVRAARQFLSQRPNWHTKTIRFDVIVVCPRRLPRHILNAWSADDQIHN